VLFTALPVQADYNGGDTSSVHLATLASTCSTLMCEAPFSHVVAATVTISTTTAMKRSRIILGISPVAPVQQRTQTDTISSSRAGVKAAERRAGLKHGSDRVAAFRTSSVDLGQRDQVPMNRPLASALGRDACGSFDSWRPHNCR
jgi:hypothetical protein